MAWVPYMWVVISGLSSIPVADLSSSNGGGVGFSFVGLQFLAPLQNPELASPPPRSRPSRPARPLASCPGGGASPGTLLPALRLFDGWATFALLLKLQFGDRDAVHFVGAVGEA